LFQEHPLVYVINASGELEWRRLSQCVWRSSIPLNSRTSLQPVFETKAVCASLLQTALQVADAGVSDYLDELRSIKSEGLSKLSRKPLTHKVTQIYKEIDRLMSRGDCNIHDNILR
jgi:hypothetical protein